MQLRKCNSRLDRSARRLLRRSVLALLVSGGGLTFALGIEACASDASTSGRRVSLETRVELVPEASSFTTAAGWDVTLTKALVATGPFYYFDGPPPLVQRALPWLRQYALSALGLGLAHAHPGHYQAGNALGQMLEPWSLDLLAGPADLPPGDGVTGTYRSARFSFAAPPEGPMAGEMQPHSAVVEGRAERAGESVRLFRATADMSEIARSAAQGHVEGCEFYELDITGDGRVTISIDPKVWFDLADFSELEPSADDTPVELPADSQPKIAFTQGLAQLSAYKFSYSSP
ncbi:MAG: hypothetical protein ABW217_00325 [Polyangiaceae bacterium]